MAINGAAKFSANYGSPKGKAMKGDAKAKPAAKTRKAADAEPAKGKSKRMGRNRMGGGKKKMPAMMSDMDFGTR